MVFVLLRFLSISLKEDYLIFYLSKITIISKSSIFHIRCSTTTTPVLGIKPRGLCILGRHSTTELCPQHYPLHVYLYPHTFLFLFYFEKNIFCFQHSHLYFCSFCFPLTFVPPINTTLAISASLGLPFLHGPISLLNITIIVFPSMIL